MYYYRNNESIITYYYGNNESIITVIMSPLLRIITRSIIRNNEFIITYYRPGQLGDGVRACWTGLTATLSLLALRPP